MESTLNIPVSPPVDRHAANKNTLNAASLSLNAPQLDMPAPILQSLPCVDTITNFIGYYNAPGIYLNGKPRSAWQYSMVGTAPHTNKTTTFNAPVVPVTISMLNADGTPRFVVTDSSNCPNCTPSQLGKKVRLLSSPQPFIQPFLAGARIWQGRLHQQHGSHTVRGCSSACRIRKQSAAELAYLACTQPEEDADHGPD